jgi:Tfp pilus assembly protein PilX
MTDRIRIMTIRNERGIALVLSLFLMTALSVVAASLMFLSQTEAYSSMNYRLMSQARYGAESGIQKAANYLLNNYATPTPAGADPLAAYNLNTSPVTLVANGNAVVLSGDNTLKQSNYPVAAVQTAFAAAAKGTMASGATNVTYAPYATLLSMQQINLYSGGQATIQTWQITSQGSITTGRTAQVEVSAILETQPVPASLYAAFATSGGCGALNFNGTNTQTDSYDSTAALVGGSPAKSNSNGNVGTNGNLTEGGGATINGSLSTPRIGVGACSAGNVDALTSGGGATVTGGIVKLPQAVVLPPPAAPNPLPPTTAYNGNNQTLLDGASVGDVTVNANKTLTLCAPGLTCTITVNTISLSGNATLQILGTVILKVADQGNVSNPIDFRGGAVTNASFDPAHFQVDYAGTGGVQLNGGSQTSAMVYAPNAAVTFNGGGDFYGAVVGQTVKDTGGAKVHYDRHLATEFFLVGNALMSSFSWKKY